MKLSPIQFKVECGLTGYCHCQIIIPSTIIKTFFDFAATCKQATASSIGFKQGGVPVEYIQVHYKKHLISHMQEILFKHVVLPFLLKKLHEEKILVIGDLSLSKIFMEPDQDAIYTFEGLMPKEVYIQQWKHLPFKGTQRKKYRDIDIQVKTFLEDEVKLQEEYTKDNEIHVGDWVCFDCWLVDSNEEEVLPQKKLNLWLKIGNEEPDTVFQELFLGKKIGDKFVTNNQSIRHYFCELSTTPYTYAIAIKDILPHHYFSIENFKHHFKLKTKKDLHNKLIEVFSFGSDISQRKSIASEAFHTIIKRNNIIIAQSAIDAQKQVIIQEMQEKPDYTVYRMQKNFDEQITTLAKKQICEAVVADHIAHQESLTVTHADLKAYLNLLQRPRTKEFIYFALPATRISGQEQPIEAEMLKRQCLREKSLNHIIHYLSR